MLSDQDLIKSIQEGDEEAYELLFGPYGGRLRGYVLRLVHDEAALGADVLLEQAERRQLLQKVVEQLPEDKRAVFQMAYESDMGLREIAEELDIPVGTIKSRLYYAR